MDGNCIDIDMCIYIHMQMHMGYKPAIIKICANSSNLTGTCLQDIHH